jgi:hypothetical protein
MQQNIQGAYNLFMENVIDADKARTALGLLQLQADMLDLEDSISKRVQAGHTPPPRR